MGNLCSKLCLCGLFPSDKANTNGNDEPAREGVSPNNSSENLSVHASPNLNPIPNSPEGFKADSEISDHPYHRIPSSSGSGSGSGSRASSPDATIEAIAAVRPLIGKQQRSKLMTDHHAQMAKELHENMSDVLKVAKIRETARLSAAKAFNDTWWRKGKGKEVDKVQGYDYLTAKRVYQQVGSESDEESKAVKGVEDGESMTEEEKRKVRLGWGEEGDERTYI